MNTYIVIPTIRNLDFLFEWGNEFESCHIIVIEDSKNKSISVPRIPARSIAHYPHKEIHQDVGKKDWIFSWKSAAVRSYGFLKAWQQEADAIITLDDDCFPYTENYVVKHLQNLELSIPSEWTPTYPFRELLFARGFPYLLRKKIPVAISHGIWSEVPDLDGMTQLQHFEERYPNLPDLLHIIPPNMYFPMSAMNVAFKATVTPLMYQLLMGQDANGNSFGYDRFDDIWSGIFAKRIVDHLQLGVVSGSPMIRHARASNVFTNIRKEASGIEKNEELWLKVRNVSLTQNTPAACYKELAQKIVFYEEEYFDKLREAMIAWSEFFSK